MYAFFVAFTEENVFDLNIMWIVCILFQVKNILNFIYESLDEFLRWLPIAFDREK